MPAVLRGVPAVIATAVAVLSAISPTSPSSSSLVARAASFPRPQPVPPALLSFSSEFPFQVRRRVTAVVFVTPRGAIGVTVFHGVPFLDLDRCLYGSCQILRALCSVFIQCARS